MMTYLPAAPKTLVLFLGALALGVVVVLSAHSVAYQKTETIATEPVTAQPYQTSIIRFFEPPGFYNAVGRFKGQNSATVSRGVVVPHHLVADDVIAEVLSELAHQTFTRIVLIGPNHFELGTAPIITSTHAWVSPIGTTPPDLPTISTLIKQANYISNAPLLMEEEHAHASVLPFLAHCYPNVPVVPLALGMKLTPTDLNHLVEQLLILDTESTLYVATIDFSHYLSATEATDRDQRTASLILKKDVNAIMRLSSQFIDSPRSLVVLMKLMERLGYEKIVIRSNTNTADYLYNYTGEVTSYFGITFEK